MTTIAALTTAACVVALSPALAQAQAAGTGHAKHAQDHGEAKMSDAEFAMMMAKHHQDGIEMARLEESRGASADVKKLAAKIRQGQERELGPLQAQQRAGAAGSDHAAHIKKMESESQRAMKRLRAASGAALDHAFAEEMAKHHQQAIDMVSRTSFTDPELRTMAQKMAANQKQELSELKKHQQAGSH
ncbi:DUF305 domain-containing protein [Luteitalea sp.]